MQTFVQVNVDGLTGQIRFDSHGVRYGHTIQFVAVRSNRYQQVLQTYTNGDQTVIFISFIPQNEKIMKEIQQRQNYNIYRIL